ncbi:MAG: glycosyltransferase [Planctomycetes bacterium]|nr:glycosyltransferase [Planctomycetota bacterium]
MKVLLTETSLYSEIGGGQAVYKRLIESHPDVTFYYLTEGDSRAGHPDNAIPIKLSPLHGRLHSKSPYLQRRILLDSFVFAERVARAIAGQHFDIIDTPDYSLHGLFLRPALRRHRIGFGSIVLAMHGTVSKALYMNWGTYSRRLIAGIRIGERLNYHAADVRYGLSRSYIDEWKRWANIEALYLDPRRCLPAIDPKPWPSGSELPRLVFIARKEKRKGPDLFIDLLWWLGEGSYQRASIIGPEAYSPDGTSAQTHLSRMIQMRHLSIEQRPPMSADQLQSLFASRVITVLPSRWDTFNLIAMESLFAGCPTVIGSGAGACRFLDEAFPEVPYTYLDMNDPYGSTVRLRHLIENYDAERERLVEALSSAQPTASGRTLQEIYSATPVANVRARSRVSDLYSQMLSTVELFPPDIDLHSEAPKWALRAAIMKAPLLQHARVVKRTSKVVVQGVRRRTRAAAVHLARSVFGEAKSMLKHIRYSRWLQRDFDQLNRMPELTEAEISQKISRAANMTAFYLMGRARIFRELARLESLRGNDLIAATYKLRVMRWLGRDHIGDVPMVVETLAEHGFCAEAEVTDAMFGRGETDIHWCRDFLDGVLSKHRLNEEPKFEFVDDKRRDHLPKVTVIVSLYKAANKLAVFLRRLNQQTLLRDSQIELVLIDSGSPTNEYDVFNKCARDLSIPAVIPAVYARTRQRETIQCAWNRGLWLTRTPYVAFLGADEIVRPDCFEILADELDKNPDVHWVQGSALVTEVDWNGVLDSDVMCYDRTGFREGLHYLDCTYVAYVGALYRKSIHDRVGFYDPTFQAAGDTEFKNRALPFIEVKTLPLVLGAYLNYPEERTTLHPRAEIEDIRAWYLHRTEAGVSYAFDGRDPEDADALLRTALRYRKCFCQHWSTDVEYASTLADWLERTRSAGGDESLAPGLRTVLRAYRALDWLPSLKPRACTMYALKRVWRILRVQRHHRSILKKADTPAYKLTNDNRFEQHHWAWLTK